MSKSYLPDGAPDETIYYEINTIYRKKKLATVLTIMQQSEEK